MGVGSVVPKKEGKNDPLSKFEEALLLSEEYSVKLGLRIPELWTGGQGAPLHSPWLWWHLTVNPGVSMCRKS